MGRRPPNEKPLSDALEYANPQSSGGMLIDMGIHDFDLARWFMGAVRSVSAIGATIAYPELASVGDIDNAIVNLTFASGTSAPWTSRAAASTAERDSVGWP